MLPNRDGWNDVEHTQEEEVIHCNAGIVPTQIEQ